MLIKCLLLARIKAIKLEMRLCNCETVFSHLAQAKYVLRNLDQKHAQIDVDYDLSRLHTNIQLAEPLKRYLNKSNF